jgi:hypothetical protein
VKEDERNRKTCEMAHKELFRTQVLLKESLKMFVKKYLKYGNNLFDDMVNANMWERLSDCRQGAILLDRVDDCIPIVRTTTAYRIPSQSLSPVHRRIIEDVKTTFGNVDDAIEFNNIMVEWYISKAKKMGYHSDQALDLAKDSYICIFSVYKDSNEARPKKLVVRHKNSKQTDVLTLDHNSVVLFSTTTNAEHVHKIVSEPEATASDWYGMTCRLSKTLIRISDGVPYVTSTGRVFTLANAVEKKEFIDHKRMENSHIDYLYPEIKYALSLVL